MTRDTIYERIWGYDFETSSKSLDVYIGYLRRKTEADGEPRLIRHRARRRLHAAPGMSLRLRLTLVVAVTFALVVVGCVYAAHVSARRPAARGSRQVPAPALRALRRLRHPATFPPAGRPPTATATTGLRSPTPTRSRRSSTRDGAVASYITGPAPASGRRHRPRDRRARRPPTLSRRRGSAVTPTASLTVALPNGGAAQIAREHRRRQQRAVFARHAAAADRAGRHDRRRARSRG